MTMPTVFTFSGVSLVRNQPTRETYQNPHSEREWGRIVKGRRSGVPQNTQLRSRETLPIDVQRCRFRRCDGGRDTDRFQEDGVEVALECGKVSDLEASVGVCVGGVVCLCRSGVDERCVKGLPQCQRKRLGGIVTYSRLPRIRPDRAPYIASPYFLLDLVHRHVGHLESWN